MLLGFAFPVVAPLCLGSAWGSEDGGEPRCLGAVSSGIKGSLFPRYHMVINAWNGKRVELLIKSLSLISEDCPSFRV